MCSPRENEELVKDARERVQGGVLHELGILFLYHKTDKVTNRNLGSFVSSNPHHCIVPISVQKGMYFQSGYWLEHAEAWERLTNYEPKRCWYNMDMAYYEYYRMRRENCKRWLLVEWDVYCNGRVEDFFGTLWNEDFVSSNVHRPGGGWNWFKETRLLPDAVRPYAMGISPLAGTLVSDACMERMVLDSWMLDVFCELRMATLATQGGFKIKAHAKGASKVRWRVPPVVDGKGLWHPVKSQHVPGNKRQHN